MPAVPRTWGTAREATAVKTGASRGRGRALGVMIGRHGSSVQTSLKLQSSCVPSRPSASAGVSFAEMPASKQNCAACSVAYANAANASNPLASNQDFLDKSVQPCGVLLRRDVSRLVVLGRRRRCESCHALLDEFRLGEPPEDVGQR